MLHRFVPLSSVEAGGLRTVRAAADGANAKVLGYGPYQACLGTRGTVPFGAHPHENPFR